MIAVAIEPHTACMGTLGITLVFSFLLNQIVATEHLAFQVGKTAIVLIPLLIDSIGSHHNLVEQVPGTIVSKCTDTLFNKHVVPWIIHISCPHLADLRLTTQSFGHTLVGGVVIKVTHHEDLPLGILKQKVIFDDTHLTGGTLTIEGSAVSTGPVANDNSHAFIGQDALDRQEATGLEGAVFRKLGHIGRQLHILHRKQRGVIEHGAIHTSAVRTFDMHELHTTGTQRLLVNKIAQRPRILHLRKSDNGTAHIRKHVCSHIGQCPCHILKLMRVFPRIPTVTASGKILIVVLALIMTCIKQILLIIETYSINRVFLLRRSNSHDTAENNGKKDSQSIHNYVIFCKDTKKREHNKRIHSFFMPSALYFREFIRKDTKIINK